MTNNCGNCKFREVESYEEPCSSCRCTRSGTPTKWVSQHEPQTNADRIRAMSDDELAEFLTHINPTNCQDCAFSVGWRCQPDRDNYSGFDKCKEGRKRWLKQPAEE